MTVRTIVAGALLALLPASVLNGQSAPLPRWRTTIDLGVVNTTGNSRLRTVNLSEQLVYHAAPLAITQTASVVNGYSAGQEVANSLKAGLRGDYDLAARLRAYGQLVYERNRFAGIARRFEEAAGLSYGALTGPKHVLDLEAGAGVNQQRGTGGPVENFWLARGAARYRYNITGNAYGEEKAEVLENLQTTADTRVNSETALVAPLSRNVALKLGYVVRFDNVPEPGFKKTDQIFSSGLQVVF
jgi:putative salt-induced outer membrane protein